MPAIHKFLTEKKYKNERECVNICPKKKDRDFNESRRILML